MMENTKREAVVLVIVCVLVSFSILVTYAYKLLFTLNLLQFYFKATILQGAGRIQGTGQTVEDRTTMESCCLF